MSKRIDVAAVAAAWQGLEAGIGELRVPETEADYNATVAQLDALLDATHGDQGHPLASLVDLVGDLVAAWESKHLEEAHATPAEVLRLLMESNRLRQTDLAGELGGQSVVSDLLSGRRKFNARQAANLAQRFNVSVELFIEKASLPTRSAIGMLQTHFVTAVRAPEARTTYFALIRFGLGAAKMMQITDVNPSLEMTSTAPNNPWAGGLKLNLEKSYVHFDA